MMPALTAVRPVGPTRGVAPHALRRGLLAGTAWGLAMGAVLTAVNVWDCGVVCLPDLAVTTALAMAAGIATIGPLAAFGRRAQIA
jgi:hypothetical protein